MLAAAFELLAECGASRLTTREVARRAGVSEGSVFYHFTDRTGLMTAVIEDGLGSLRTVNQDGLGTGDLDRTLLGFATAVEGFLDRALVVMIAAQSDSELRDGLATYLVDNNMGPHIGIQLLTNYLKDQQDRGLVRADADVEAVAYLVYSAGFQRVAQRQMITKEYGHALPGTDRLAATVARLLAPVLPDSSLPDSNLPSSSRPSSSRPSSSSPAPSDTGSAAETA
jgi:AcrR family transcriptional regulator